MSFNTCFTSVRNKIDTFSRNFIHTCNSSKHLHGHLLISRCSSSTDTLASHTHGCAYTWTVHLTFYFHLGLQAVYWRKSMVPRISVISWQFEDIESSKQFWVQATCGAPTQCNKHLTLKFSHLKWNRIVKKSLPHFSYNLYQVLLPVLLIPSNFIPLKILPQPQIDNEKVQPADVYY